MAGNVVQALRQRADQLDNEAISARVTQVQTAPGRTPEALQMMAAEFRAVADLAEHYDQPPG